MKNKEMKLYEKIVEIYTNIFAKYPEYFMDTSYYEVSMEYQKVHLESIENVIEDDIPIEVICLKLVHNMTMIFQYAKNMISTTGGSVKAGGMKPNLFIRIAVEPEYIKITKRKGFGLIGYNVDDMATILFDTNTGIKNFLCELINKDKKYQNLKIIIDNFFNYSCNDINSALVELISKNLELYKKYSNS